MLSSVLFLSLLATTDRSEGSHRAESWGRSQPHFSPTGGGATGPAVGLCTPCEWMGAWICGSRGSDAQTNSHTRVPEALPNHHTLRLLITWADGNAAWAPNKVVNLDVTCFGCGLRSRARESFCRKYSILMMFIVTDIRMGEFCKCHQASWPVVGNYLVSENWPSAKRSLQIMHKISELGEIWGDYLYSSLGLQMPSFYLFFPASLKSCTSFAFPFTCEMSGVKTHCNLATINSKNPSYLIVPKLRRKVYSQVFSYFLP